MPLRVSGVPPLLLVIDAEGFVEQALDARQNARNAVRVGVIDKLHGHAVGAGAAQRVRHEHGAQRRAPDAHAQHAGEARGGLGPDAARMHIGGELADGGQRVLNFRRDLRRGRQSGRAQPVMAHHAVLVRIGDGAVLQVVHGAEGMLHLRLQPLAEARLEVHAAGVQRQTDSLHPAKALAITVPQLRLGDVCLHAIFRPRGAIFSTQGNRSEPGVAPPRAG